ncbi:MAG: hypothetical protein ACSHX0_06895 [Akkermansiaceae bacterium]
MPKNTLVQFTLFDTRPVVDGKKLYPLTAGRLRLLEELENPLASGDFEGEVDTIFIYEVFLVVALSSEDLAEKMRDKDAFKHEVLVSSLSMADEVLNAFWDLLQDEMTAAARKMTVPAAKQGKHRGARKAAKKATRSQKAKR